MSRTCAAAKEEQTHVCVVVREGFPRLGLLCPHRTKQSGVCPSVPASERAFRRRAALCLLLDRDLDRLGRLFLHLGVGDFFVLVFVVGGGAPFLASLDCDEVVEVRQ